MDTRRHIAPILFSGRPGKCRNNRLTAVPFVPIFPVISRRSDRLHATLKLRPRDVNTNRKVRRFGWTAHNRSPFVEWWLRDDTGYVSDLVDRVTLKTVER